MSSHIHKTAIIYPNVTIGENVYIGPYCIIGAPAESTSKHSAGVRIGNNVKIHGLVTIDAGTQEDTVIQDNCYLMKQTHVGHDAVLLERVYLSPGARVGGHCWLCQGVNMGMNATCHQMTVIPEWCMIGANSFVNNKQELKPFGVYVGSPVRWIKENTYPIEKGLI